MICSSEVQQHISAHFVHISMRFAAVMLHRWWIWMIFYYFFCLHVLSSRTSLVTDLWMAAHISDLFSASLTGLVLSSLAAVWKNCTVPIGVWWLGLRVLSTTDWLGQNIYTNDKKYTGRKWALFLLNLTVRAKSEIFIDHLVFTGCYILYFKFSKVLNIILYFKIVYFLLSFQFIRFTWCSLIKQLYNTYNV